MSRQTIMANLGFILRFGLLGGLIGTLIYSPFDNMTPTLYGSSIYNYVGTSLLFGYVFLGIPAATLAGVAFRGFQNLGLADNHHQKTWWLACLAGMATPLLFNVAFSFSAGNFHWSSHWAGKALHFFVATALTAYILELMTQRRRRAIGMWAIAGLVWYLSVPAVRMEYTQYSYMKREIGEMQQDIRELEEAIVRMQD